MKKLKDNANAKEDLDEYQEELLKEEPQKAQEEEVKENVTFMKKEEPLLEDNQPVNGTNTANEKKVENLLEMEEPEKVETKQSKAESLLDLEEPSEKKYSTTIQSGVKESNIYATQANNSKN